MKYLTDSMIENVLNETVYVTESPWTVIAIIGAVVLFLLFIFLKANNARQKILSGLLVIIFLIMGVGIIARNDSVKNAIDNDEWTVVTDTVDRVMEKTENGHKSYFMVLEKYGRVSLDNYSDAMQYYSGAKVYVVVVPKGGEYKSTGVTYPTDTYIYVGNH